MIATTFVLVVAFISTLIPVTTLMVISVISMVISTIPVIAMTFLVTRYILMVVPAVPHKIDLLATGVVFTTMLAPFFGMTWWYTQIDRLSVHRIALDYHRSAIDYLWLRIIANIKSTIETRLAYIDGDANIGSKYRGANNSRHCYSCSRCNKKMFHIKYPD